MRFLAWLTRHGASVALFVAGAITMLLTVVVHQDPAVGTAMVAVAGGLLVVGALSPRLVGPMEFGAQGLKAELLETATEVAAERDLPADETATKLDELRRDLDALAKRDRERDDEARRQEVRRRLVQSYVGEEVTGEAIQEAARSARRAALESARRNLDSPKVRHIARESAKVQDIAKKVLPPPDQGA